MTIRKAMKKWLAGGHIFALDAVRIEASGVQAWVVDAETGRGIKLFPSRLLAEQAVRRNADSI